MFIVMAGLPGAGKSTFARALAEALHAFVLDKDRVRAALFSPDAIEYATTQDDFCVDVMLQTAAYLLRSDPHRRVILDGRTFSRRYQIDAVLQATARLQTPLKLIHCVCRDETALTRLAQDRASGDHPATNRDAQLYHAVKARFEPLTIPHLVVDTDNPFDTCLSACLHFLNES